MFGISSKACASCVRVQYPALRAHAPLFPRQQTATIPIRLASLYQIENRSVNVIRSVSEQLSGAQSQHQSRVKSGVKLTTSVVDVILTCVSGGLRVWKGRRASRTCVSWCRGQTCRVWRRVRGEARRGRFNSVREAKSNQISIRVLYRGEEFTLDGTYGSLWFCLGAQSTWTYRDGCWSWYS